MHAPEPTPPGVPVDSRGWWRELSGYHWFVLIVAMLGWLFDTMDQQLFALARAPAVAELVAAGSPEMSPDDRAKSAVFMGGLATMIFMIGWATGGLIFGVMGDRIGRVKTLCITIMLYSAFTGLSSLSVGLYDFFFYRFLSGLGVGGEFAVGVALVAETMPDRARTPALGWLQASSAIGNIMAGTIGILSSLIVDANGLIYGWAPWRWMFVVGTGPALLVLLIMARLREPERWLQAKARRDAGEKGPSMADLFRDPVLRKNSLIGLALGFSGVVGLWGIGFFAFEMIGKVLTADYLAAGLTAGEAKKQVGYWVGWAGIYQNIGGFFGVLSFAWVTQRIGRRPAFLIAFLAAMGATAFFFSSFSKQTDIYWMNPLLGFCQLMVFGGFAIYFPELFPTRLRSTGISFCYNIGRYLASVGPLTLGILASYVYGGYGNIGSYRYAGVTMCSFFLIGIATLAFAPETKGKPLPE